MKKLTLKLEDLAVASFDLLPGKGGVAAQSGWTGPTYQPGNCTGGATDCGCSAAVCSQPCVQPSFYTDAACCG